MTSTCDATDDAADRPTKVPRLTKLQQAAQDASEKRLARDARVAAYNEDLRKIKSKHAPEVVIQAKKIREAMVALMEINEKIKLDAEKSSSHDNYTSLLGERASFDVYGSMESQFEGGVHGPGFEDVYSMAGVLERVANESAADAQI